MSLRIAKITEMTYHVRAFAQPRKARTLMGRGKAEPAGVHMPCLKAVLRGVRYRSDSRHRMLAAGGAQAATPPVAARSRTLRLRTSAVAVLTSKRDCWMHPMLSPVSVVSVFRHSFFSWPVIL